MAIPEQIIEGGNVHDAINVALVSRLDLSPNPPKDGLGDSP